MYIIIIHFYNSGLLLNQITNNIYKLIIKKIKKLKLKLNIKTDSYNFIIINYHNLIKKTDTDSEKWWVAVWNEIILGKFFVSRDRCLMKWEWWDH